jgi:tRNA threonylcarbamoyladenosine biosynthesis protein TsaB
VLVTAFETSGGEGSVALLRGETLLAETRLGGGTRHGVELHPALQALLRGADAAPADLGLVVVGVGPGSFTGMRVAVAAARSLAWALGIPVIGVASVDAVAAAAPVSAISVVVARDERKGMVSLAIYGPSEPIPKGLAAASGAIDGIRPRTLDPVRLPLEEAAKLPQRGALVLGDAAAALAAAANGLALEVGDDASGIARAPALGLLGLRRFLLEGAPDASTVVPLYLQEPATTPRGGGARA